MARGNLLYNGLTIGLLGSVVTDAFLAYSLWTQASTVLSITSTDRVQSVMLQSYAALVQSQMFLLFAAAVLALGLIGVLSTLRRWESMMESSEE